MSKIIIDIIDSSYVLSGDIDAIKNNRRAKSNFESIGSDFSNSERIILPFDDSEGSNKEELYQDIINLFGKFNLQSSGTSKAKGFLKDILQKEQDFTDFSEKAKKIRNNEHEGNDFKHFTDVIEKTLERKLYTLQLLSAYHLAFAQNACNFSVPGAGKTSIVYATYAYLKNLPSDNRKSINRLLIISPLAAFAPWENEYIECFGEKAPVRKLVNLTARERHNYFYSEQGIEITLISYHSASSDAKYIIDYLKRWNDVMIVLDEAHKIKNTEGGRWAESILSVAEYARARVVLTGTPAPNGYQDLYNLYKFIWPHKDIIKFPLHYLYNLYRPDDKKELVDNISPFFIRIKKSDLGLPDPKYYEPIYVPMTPEQKNIYEYIEDKYIDDFESYSDGGSFTGDLRKAKLIRLRQCLTNPMLLQRPLIEYQEVTPSLGIEDRDIMQAIQDYESVPNKFIEVGNLVEKISKNYGADGKTIVWSNFIDNITSLENYLKNRNIECETLYGATPNEDDATTEDMITREKIIKRFHDDDCPYKVIIANPFAVGESISLHKACHNAIYLEKDFNATNYMQSKDRIHRYGLNQSDIINYYYLLSEDSIDLTIHERVLEKEEQMLRIIEQDEIPLLYMNMDDIEDENDIRAIIRDYHDRKSSKAS